MLTKLPHYLTISRHGIYYLRYTRNGKERRFSLKTRNPLIARAASYAFGAKMHGMTIGKNSFSYLLDIQTDGSIKINTDGSKEDHANAMEALAIARDIELRKKELSAELMQNAAATTLAQPPQPSSTYPIKVTDGVKAYQNARAGQITAKTAAAWSSHTTRLVSEFHPDQLIHAITPGQITDSLKRLEDAGRAIKTIKGYAQTWHMMWDWWIAHGYAINNPVITPKYGKAMTARMNAERGRERAPWSSGDLTKLFSIDRMNGLTRPEDAFMPLLGIYTGARREAIARLKLNDFVEYEPGNWCVRFDPQFDKIGREREIPLHPTLIDAGLINYLNDVRSLGLDSDYLFPHLLEINGSTSHYFGKTFGDMRKKLGINQGSDFHALRTTLISVLALNNSPPQPRRAFVGHESEKQDVHDKHYVKGVFGPKKLAEEVFPYMNFGVIDFAWSGWKYQVGSAISQIKAIIHKQQRSNMQRTRKA